MYNKSYGLQFKIYNKSYGLQCKIRIANLMVCNVRYV